MSGSSFGRVFRVTTFGESHGSAIGVIVEGVPPGLEIRLEDIQHEMDRRRPGQSKISTPRRETDEVEILAGVFEGRAMGPPIAMLVRNRDQDPSAYAAIKDRFRPGHADYSYLAKYGVRDWRGSGRASGRETACRVAAGAVAKLVLAQRGIRIVGYSLEIDGVRAENIDLNSIEGNIVRCPDAAKVEPMIARIEAAREAEDSVGGVVEVVASGCPPGLGDPVFDKLEAMLGHAVMSIGAVKAFEVGVGCGCAAMRGSDYNDPLYVEAGRVRTRTNNAGGIIGGISTGENIVVRATIRPPASIAQEQSTLNSSLEPDTIVVHGRHDPCIVPRAVPVVEAMVGIALADRLLIQQMYEGQQGISPGATDQ